MQQLSKKFLAILLTLCMLMSFAPVGVFAAEAGAEVVEQQLMLGDDLSMHFYTKAENASTADISVGGIVRESYSIDQMTAGENGYDFSVNLAAAEMTEEIVLTVRDGANEILKKTSSVQDYARELLENNYTDETKAMVKELLNYGAKAQLYFDHNTQALANAGYEMETSVQIGTQAPAVEVSDNLSGVNFYGASLVFESKPAVRFYFTANDGIAGYTVDVEGKSFTGGMKNGKYYIEIADIDPDELDKALKVSVTKGDEALRFSYSPLTYILRMYNRDSASAELKALLKAAFGYFVAARAFTGVAENRTGSLSFAYRYGTANLIQINTNLPADTPCVNFTANDNGCSIDQSANQYQQFGWVGMDNVDGTIVLTLHFGGAFEAGQTYVLPKGAVFGFTDNSKYTLDKNYTFTYDGNGWSMVAEEPAIDLAYRWGNGNTIQFNTNLPATTPCASFLAGDNGCNILQSGDQQLGWASMSNAEGTIVLTFNFNGAFAVGQSYTLSAGSVFGFTDGSKYELKEDITLYWDGSNWVAEPPVLETPALNFLACSYGTSNLIQLKTDLPSSTPCVSFLASDNGCEIDQSANKYQQVAWIGMAQDDAGNIYLALNFNGAFEAGQTYVLPKGAVFGFTDGNKYELKENYTFTFNGNSWDVTTPEDPMAMAYRWGNSNTIQFNTDLPATTPCASFLAGDNGCNILQSGDQQLGWAGMDSVDGVIVLTFNFNGAFEVGQSYTLSAGSVFGFTDGSKYELYEDITLYWDGANWVAEPPVLETPALNFLACSYGTSNLIQLKTDLPSSTPCVSFLASDNGCEIDQSANKYQQVAWIGMAQDDAGNIYLALNFNGAFEAGQTYVLPKGAVFGFTDGNKYALKENYTFTFNGNSWDVTTPEDPMAMAYRWGNSNTIQFNTDLPATTPCADFLAGDNGCHILQSGDRQFGWASMSDAEGTIVLTFNFNGAFEVGQSYTLSAGSVFGFTDGSKYELYEDITLYWNGSQWSNEAPKMDVSLSYRWGNHNTIQYNTDLPASTPIANFTADQNGCNLQQGANQYQQVGWIGMENVDGTIVLTFHFNAAFEAGQSYIIPAGSVFGFTDGSSYTLPNDVILYWNGAAWEMTAPITLTYRYGTNNLIQYNTNLSAETPCANFLASDNGCALTQNGQQVGWVGMENVDGTIVLTFHFNTAFAYGESYTLSAGSVFGFTDGSIYKLYQDTQLYWADNGWTAEEPAPETDVLEESNFTGGDVITFADLPVDSKDPAKIEQYKQLGFNTSLLAEDHTGAKGPDELYTVSLNTANAPSNSLNFAYRWGNSNTLQINTNLPATTPIANFTADQNGCSIDQSGNTVQWVGWIGMANADGTIVLTFNFNQAFAAGQSYVLPKGAVFGFTDGNTYTLDADYTFTWDGTNWSMDASTLHFSLSAGAGKYMQLKTNIPAGLSYGDFLLGDTSKGNLILETTEGAQSVAWFQYGELGGNVYLVFHFNGYHKPGTQYILKAGTSLKAGDRVYTTDRDYILTVGNDYLTSLENIDNAGLNVWIRNYHNITDYFTGDLTAALKLYEDTIDGFYMTDEPFQTAAMQQASGQASASDLESMTTVRDWFNQNFADKYFHINHVPLSSWDHYTATNGASLSGIDVDGYRNFLSTYKANFNDQLTNASGASVSFDNYPFVHEQGTYGGFFGIGGNFESGIQDTYLLNCLIAAQVADEDDFGLCIQTFNATDLKNKTSRDIASAAEVSLQLYTGFAMGADVFEYFAYNSNSDFNGILNQDGSKRIYDIVKEGNNALCFADVVNSFAWNGIVTSAGSSNSHNADAFTSVADMVLTNGSDGVLNSYRSTDDAVIGCFTKDDLNGYMVVNFNDPKAVTGNNTVTMSFEGCTRARVYTQVDGVLTSEIVDLANGTYEAILAPGAGCFIIPA